MRKILNTILILFLCLTLTVLCACGNGGPTVSARPDSSTTPQPSGTDLPPEDSADPSVTPSDGGPVDSGPIDSDPDVQNSPSGDIPAIYPDEETELRYYLGSIAYTAPAILHYSVHGYSMVYDMTLYSMGDNIEVDSYQHGENIFLSVSVSYGVTVDSLLDSLREQENLQMEPETAAIGSKGYLAKTLYHTTKEGVYRQYWVLDYAGDAMLIVQSCPVDLLYSDVHFAIQSAMLDSLTLLDDTLPTYDRTMASAYIALLEDLYSNHVFPDGTDVDLSEEYDMADNQFAVFDVDNDGIRELVLLYVTAVPTATSVMVYEFDPTTGHVDEEFSEYSDLTFYDNGIIEAAWPDDQEYSGEFVSHNLYAYDAQTDSYTAIASVDAWDSSYSRIHYSGILFPQDADLDGDGIVYYVMTGGYSLTSPLDGAQYRLWRESYLAGAQVLELPFLSLTPENIYTIS